jgi:DNA modification methylase
MDKGHPCEKPVELLTWCLGLVPEAQTVLDPFAGSGTTGRAAKDLGRKAVLIEREEKYCEIAARRMGQEVLCFDNLNPSRQAPAARKEP